MTMPLDTVAAALVDGRLDPAQAARAAGYGSEAAFAAAFRECFRTGPADFAAPGASGRHRFAYDAPFDAEMVLAYLGRDPANAAERVTGREYRRYLAVDGRRVPVSLTLEPDGCTVTPGTPLEGKAAVALHHAVVRFLGLEQPLAAFAEQAGADPVMGPLLRRWPGLRIPQTPTAWEALCWAVLGQQINLSFAYRLRNRLVCLANGLDAGAPPDGDPLPFPTPEQVRRVPAEALRAQQFSRSKVRYLHAAAEALDSGEPGRLVARGAPPEELEPALRAVPGIGPWTGAYVLMRGLGYTDALPVGDAGLRAAMRARFALAEAPDAAQQAQLMAPFRPYRSLACYYLWKSLSLDRAA